MSPGAGPAALLLCTALAALAGGWSISKTPSRPPAAVSEESFSEVVFFPRSH